MASEYYTLLLETDPKVHQGDILKTLKKRFGFSGPDLNDQLTISRRWRAVGSPSASGPTGYSAYPGFPSADVHAQVIPRLCYGAEDRDAGMYAPWWSAQDFEGGGGPDAVFPAFETGVIAEA